MNDLPVVVNFGNFFRVADDFNFLANGNLESEIQSNLEQVARGLIENKRELAPNKCSQLVIEGRIPSFQLAGGPLGSSIAVADLHVVVNPSLTRPEHFGNGLKRPTSYFLFEKNCQTK